MYMDGNLIANWTRGEISTGNAATFQFGRWRNDSNAYFQGSLDDLRIYDSALGGNEIQQIFAGKDIREEFIEHQFNLFATGDPTEFSISGLPDGLKVDSDKGEVVGVPSQVGIFDLNVSAFNMAGAGRTSLKLIVSKTKPLSSSISPKAVTSSSAKMSVQIMSDGGEPVRLTII